MEDSMKKNNESVNLKTKYKDKQNSKKIKQFLKSGDCFRDLWNNINQNNIHIINERRERKGQKNNLKK